MELVYLGKIVNTHGIKGEIRIISDFEKKDLVFKVGITIYAGPKKIKMKIDSYRKHKNFDMITFNNITDIKDVLEYKGLNVYVDRELLSLKDNEYIKSDLFGMEVIYNNKVIGIIDDIEKNGLNELIVINDKLIPYNEHFIKSVDIKNKKIELQNIEGLL